MTNRIQTISLAPSSFNTTHMYVALAIAESLLEKEGYGLPWHVDLDHMDNGDIHGLFSKFLKDVHLEALYVKT